jgi:hypothetical protein
MGWRATSARTHPRQRRQLRHTATPLACTFADPELGRVRPIPHVEDLCAVLSREDAGRYANGQPPAMNGMDDFA